MHTLGAIRTCAVLLGGKPSTSEERCTSYEERRSIMWTIERDTSGFSRMASDWQAGFALTPDGTGRTRVTARSLFRPSRPLARMMLPMIRRRFHQTQRSGLAELKRHTEH